MPDNTGPWVLSTQADIDKCGDDLLALGWGSQVRRFPPMAGNANQTVRSISIDPLPGTVGSSLLVEQGNVVVLVFGIPTRCTPEQYETSPYYQQPA